MKKYENLFKQILTCVTLLCASPLAAQDTVSSYSPAQLTEQASAWLEQELAVTPGGSIQVQASPLDDRIGYKHCNEPLQFSLSQPLTQRQNTIQIRCGAEQSWQLYLPVRIEEIVQTVILTQNISSGSLLTADMLDIANRERRFLRGSLVSDPRQIIGAKTRRAMSIGQIITLQDLCLVCKGDVVTISVSNNGLNVAATGIAQSDGSLGDVISVLNRQSKRAITAEVIAVNQVSIKF
ncbi:flagella basal body P-ring formation protein FlgA [Rheinheimera pacifica]|uniref:Flagella basal body P-ring formation protein FlgA n=1 Tax=Rheinheimera pacifica TaxID=173990 RepID=A0A1H6MPX2_9GAMM|nr:flagellar basal body P-ring formation chaperone FlgA [Rheinheimera pacifica]SEH99977.1 flagella basal body P-ring formation protein FlgA [Rheinheimera pacifica]